MVLLVLVLICLTVMELFPSFISKCCMVFVGIWSKCPIRGSARVVFEIWRPFRGSAREFSKFDAHSEGLNGLLHCCNNPFGGQNGLLHVATTYSVGRTVFYMLQQPIRWAKWSFACCNNPFGGQNGLLHGCNTISYACKPLWHR